MRGSVLDKINDDGSRAASSSVLTKSMTMAVSSVFPPCLCERWQL